MWFYREIQSGNDFTYKYCEDVTEATHYMESEDGMVGYFEISDELREELSE